MVRGRESVIEVLERLKAQEPERVIRKEVPRIAQSVSKEERNVKIVNLPQQEVESLMRKISELESKMRSDSGSYFSLYYELRKLEEEFVVKAERLLAKDFDVTDVTRDRVKARLEKIRKGKGLGTPSI